MLFEQKASEHDPVIALIDFCKKQTANRNLYQMRDLEVHSC